MRLDRKTSDVILRNADIIRRFEAGELYESIGNSYGLTRERVRQIANKYGADRGKRERAKAEQALDKRLEALKKKLLCAPGPCLICGCWIVRSYNYLTCSEECGEIWLKVRYHIDEDTRRKWQRRQAKYILAHPEKHAESRVRFARKIARGEQPRPNRRFVVSESMLQALRKLPADQIPEDLRSYVLADH